MTRRFLGVFISPSLLLAFSLLSLVLVIGFGAFLITAKSVNVVINGVRYEVRTHQHTLGGLIRELGLLIEPNDRLSLPLDAVLVNGVALAWDKARQVLVEADGQTRRIYTYQESPRAILLEAGVIVGLYDQVFVDGMYLEAAAALPSHIRVLRARTITIQDGAQRITQRTVATTVGAALAEARISLFVADRVSPALGERLRDDQIITIRRSVPLQISVDDQQVPTRSAAQTVGEALAESGVVLVGLDYAMPEESASLTPNLSVQVVRVTEEDQIERAEIDYQQVFQPDTSIPPETTRLVQAGVKGLLERRIRVRREDGVIVSRSLPEDVIVRDPRDEIIAVGATPALITPAPTPTQPKS